MTTIQEAREQTMRQVSAETTIEIKYPHTRLAALPGGQSEWTSPEMLDDAERVALLGRPHVHVALTVNVEGIKVYHPTYMELGELLKTFETKDPAGYRRLVSCFVDVVRAKDG